MVFIFMLLLAVLSSMLYAQNTIPKREFRAVFLASVNNLDFPSSNSLSTQAQKNEFISFVDKLQNSGFNAVIGQVRPAADAFYESSLEPWSAWLTGRQGEAPRPYYDPLAFMIEECHRRGIEFHAWINPYRAVHHVSGANVCAQHITKRKPEWFFTYDGSQYFDPGNPEARQFIIKVIADIVSRYDVDGIHFDDYFYPYPNVKNPFTQDHATYYKYKGKFTYIDDWRRNNVNTLIREVSENVHSINPRIKFGISPYAIWREKSVSADGSDSRVGQSCYDHLYADVRLWLQKGWIDYVAPQLYQHTKFEPAPFKKIALWWEANCFGRNLYISHASYRYMLEENSSWNDKNEMYEQLRFVRQRQTIQGSVYYSYSKLIKNKGNFFNALQDDFYRTPALQPTMPWLDSVPPLPPLQLYVQEHALGNKLSWLTPKPANDGEVPFQYVVYAFPANQRPDFGNPNYILAILSASQTAYIHVFRRNYEGENPYQYFVTSLDRLHNESQPWSEQFDSEQIGVVGVEESYQPFQVASQYPYTNIHVSYFYQQTLQILKEWLQLSEENSQEQVLLHGNN